MWRPQARTLNPHPSVLNPLTLHPKPRYLRACGALGELLLLLGEDGLDAVLLHHRFQRRVVLVVAVCARGSGHGAQGVGFRAWGSGHGAQGVGFRVQGEVWRV